MNKPLIYTYITQLEKELKTVLVNNRFADLIISEIINESIIVLHECSNSSMSDEETAKGNVCLHIESFYKPEHLNKVIDKYWNERLSYGFRGRIMATPDNLIRFRASVDTTRKEVMEEKNAMLYAIKNTNLKQNPANQNKPLARLHMNRMIKVSLLLFALIIALLFALNGRYIKVADEYYFDKWTKTMLEIGKYEVIE